MKLALVLMTGKVVDLVEEDREDTSRLYQLNLSEHSAQIERPGPVLGVHTGPGALVTVVKEAS